MLSTLRRALVAVCICAGLSGAGASVASAGSDYYWHQYDGARTIGPGYSWATGNPHSINANVGAVNAWACVGAIDYYGGNLSGTGYCGNWSGPIWVSHPYDASTLRDGAVYPYGSGYGTLYEAWETY